MTEFVYERFSQSLAANAVLRMAMAADELRIAASSYAVTVNLLQGGRVLGSASGMLAGDYVRGVAFDAFEIVNGGNAQTVVIKLASGQSGSDRIVGEVSVISGEVTRSKNGESFLAGMHSPAVVGSYSAVQLFNPLASGKRLIVNQIITSLDSGSGGTIYLRDSVTAIGALFPAAPNPLAKLFGGAVSVAENRFLAAASQQGNFFTHINALAFDSVIYNLREPIVIVPGRGLILSSAAVTVGVVASVNYWEETL